MLWVQYTAWSYAPSAQALSISFERSSARFLVVSPLFPSYQCGGIASGFSNADMQLAAIMLSCRP
jgi:hypothetical protein